MEQLVIARKKLREAAGLLKAANERKLAQKAKVLAHQVDQQQYRPFSHQRETWEALFRTMIEGAHKGANRRRR